MMKTKWMMALTLTLLCGPTQAVVSYSIVNDWTTFDSANAVYQIAAGGVNATWGVSEGTKSYADGTADLSGADYSANPGTDAQNLPETGANELWTLTLEHATDILLYAYYWRAGTYQFDSAFTIASGFLSGAQIVGDSLVLTDVFSMGILAFTDPLTSLKVTATPSDTNGIATDFAFHAAVPEPAAALLAGLGGLGALLVRRKRD